MRTLGIDLAAQPANTSVCAIDWVPSAPVVSDGLSGIQMASQEREPPESEDDVDRAVREGWIHVPTNPLSHLLES